MTAPVHLLWGEDPFLLREAAMEILGDARAIEIDAAVWQPGQLRDLSTPSLFGEPRALLIDDAKSLTKEATAELAAYLEAPDLDALRERSQALGEKRPLYPGFRGFTSYAT
jgi:DNA polymerase III subunit delta